MNCNYLVDGSLKCENKVKIQENFSDDRQLEIEKRKFMMKAREIMKRKPKHRVERFVDTKETSKLGSTTTLTFISGGVNVVGAIISSAIEPEYISGGFIIKSSSSLPEKIILVSSTREEKFTIRLAFLSFLIKSFR